MGRSGKGSTTVGWPGWFPRVVTETDTGHEGPERPRGPTGGPLAATDGERRVGRALPRHGHALPTEPAILEFSNSTPLFQLRSSEVLGANVAPRTHGGRRLPGRPPGECAPRSTEAGADAAPRQGPRAAPTQVLVERCRQAWRRAQGGCDAMQRILLRKERCRLAGSPEGGTAGQRGPV